MLRWTALKFVAAPRKGTVLDPGFSIGKLFRDRSVFIPKNKKQTFGEMKLSSKHKIDHRSIAFKKIKKFL